MKKLLFMLCAVLALSVSVFADSSSFVSQQSYINNGVSYNIYSNYDDVRFAARMNPNDSTLCSIIAFSQDSTHTYIRVNVSDGTNFTGHVDVGGTLDGVYTDTVNSALVSSLSSITPYPASTSTLTMCQDYLGSFTPDPAPISSSFTLPRGNVLYFQVASESDVTFISEFPRLSNIVTIGGGNPWGDTAAAYGLAASLPTASTKFPIASMDTVVWLKYGSTNVLGQTKTGSVTKHCIVNQWYALYNPSFAYISEQMRDAVGGTITASGSFAQIKVYPLNQELSFENGISGFNSDSTDGYASYYDGTIDSETGEVIFTNQDGVVSEPVNGGQNYQEPAIGAVGLIEQVKQTLANILIEIENLFTFGYSAIGSLVGLMSQFVNSLGQLYSWLPSEVYSAIMSAVIVAIVIGVFKVFL